MSFPANATESGYLRHLAEKAGVLPPYADFNKVRLACVRLPEYSADHACAVIFETVKRWPVAPRLVWSWSAALRRTGMVLEPHLIAYHRLEPEGQAESYLGTNRLTIDPECRTLKLIVNDVDDFVSRLRKITTFTVAPMR